MFFRFEMKKMLTRQFVKITKKNYWQPRNNFATDVQVF